MKIRVKKDNGEKETHECESALLLTIGDDRTTSVIGWNISNVETFGLAKIAILSAEKDMWEKMG